jgi:hypothetical protein
MMTANELRIGNWLQLETYIKYQINGDGYNTVLDLTIPIPLTEEILLKCGFKNGVMLMIDETENVIYFDKYDKAFYTYSGLGEPYSYGFKSNIKHLHQLQNLYFALTNQELNIEL